VILDIATRLTYGPYAELETGAEGGCLERRRCWRGGVYVLAADDAFWTLLLHVLLDDPTLLGARPPAFAKTLERLAVEARTEGPLGRVVASFLPERWSTDVLVDCVWDGTGTPWSVSPRCSPPIGRAGRRAPPAGATSPTAPCGISPPGACCLPRGGCPWRCWPQSRLPRLPWPRSWGRTFYLR